MNLKQALERIEALERRVKELEARPEHHIHYHTHPVAPIYQPPYMPTHPSLPMPFIPNVPWVTCGPNAIGNWGGN